MASFTTAAGVSEYFSYYTSISYVQLLREVSGTA